MERVVGQKNAVGQTKQFDIDVRPINVLNVPATQFVGSTLPVGHTAPVGHVFAIEELLPEFSQYLPAVHRAHVAFDAARVAVPNVPAGHGICARLRGGQKEPSVQPVLLAGVAQK